MKFNSLALLKFFLWFSCVFHLVVGIGLNVSPAFPQVMAGYYGAEVDFTPQFLYILKPLGAFMIMVGLVVMAAARDRRPAEVAVDPMTATTGLCSRKALSFSYRVSPPTTVPCVVE